MKNITDQELSERIAIEYLGWITYPSDSIEHGSVYHLNPNKAPFGPVLDKWKFNPVEKSIDFLTVLKMPKFTLTLNTETCTVTSEYNGKCCYATNKSITRATLLSIIELIDALKAEDLK